MKGRGLRMRVGVQSFDRLRMRGKRLGMKVLVDEDRLEDQDAIALRKPMQSLACGPVGWYCQGRRRFGSRGRVDRGATAAPYRCRPDTDRYLLLTTSPS